MVERLRPCHPGVTARKVRDAVVAMKEEACDQRVHDCSGGPKPFDERSNHRGCDNSDLVNFRKLYGEQLGIKVRTETTAFDTRFDTVSTAIDAVLCDVNEETCRQLCEAARAAIDAYA
jgi:hypothetical protein